MVQKKYIFIAFGILFVILLLTTISAITGNNSNLFFKESGAGTISSSMSYTLSSNYFSRISGPTTIGMYTFDNGFGRFGILKNTSAYCGNGILEAAEICDNGVENWIPCNPACDSTCTYCDTSCTPKVINGGSCDDGGGDGPGGGGGGECVNECTDESIKNICIDNKIIESTTCGNFDADNCTEWGTPTTQECENGCKDGECIQVCESDWECEEWGECSDKTDANSVLLGATLLGDAHQERRCTDTNNCAKNKIETISCTSYAPIETRISEWCDEEYVELFEPTTNKVVGKMKQKEFLGITSLKRVDINFDVSGFSGYCTYCSDKIKNHDETGIDCGGPSCPECPKPVTYIDWILYVIILSWLIFVLLIAIMAIEQKEELIRIRKFTKEKVIFIMKSAKFKSINEDDMERRILSFLGRYLKLSIFTPVLKQSKINLKRKTLPYTTKKLYTVSKEELQKNWLSQSLEGIGKRKRRGFLGKGEDIEEARKGLKTKETKHIEQPKEKHYKATVIKEIKKKPKEHIKMGEKVASYEKVQKNWLQKSLERIRKKKR